MMNHRIFVFTGVVLFTSMPAFAMNASSDFYGSLQDFFLDIYGADRNAGLTAFPLLNVPMGGRSEGMAGAFSAVSDDISFIEWNPAGSSMLSNTELAFFHNNWIADSKIESAVFATRFSLLGIAASGKWMYTPFTEYGEWGDRLSKGYYSEMAGTVNISYNFFHGYYFPGISAGVNLKGVCRSMPDFAEYSGASQSAAALVWDLGLLTRINLFKFYDSRDKNMSFALVMKNAGPVVEDEAMPTVAVAGIAYRPLRPFLVSFDFSYPLNLNDLSLSEKPFFALGFSFTVTPFLSMRSGFLLRSGGPRWTLGSSIKLGVTAVEINYSLDLATQLQPLSRVTIGVRLDLGDGGREQSAKLVDKYYLSGLDAYSRGDDDKALESFNEALKIDPNFDPAIEGVSAIKSHRDISNRLNDMIKNVEY
jgi:hypothetical protein